ncbi:MAG: ABC transporter ATP-binding protein [Chloroflexota bacterium]
MESQPLLQVKDLYLRFGGIQTLSGVSLEVREGEIVGLVGPNGAGKTSLLNVVNGLYKPQKGVVLFRGRETTRLRMEEIVRMGIARSFQHVELFRGMNVLENLLFGSSAVKRSSIFKAALYWGPGQKDELNYRRQAEEVIDFMELELYRKWPVSRLPIGVAKLVGIGRALCMKPRLLLLDEPSSGMNRDEKENLARFLLRIKYTLGIAILWVEHDIRLIGDVADRLAVLHYGRKIAEGNISEVARDPAVAAAFWGKE